MQPLAYQIGATTCWATSIINGIMFLRNGERIKSTQYKILHSALNSILRREGVPYDEKCDFEDYESVIEVLKTQFPLSFTPVRGSGVKKRIAKLNYKEQVAVCDVGAGDHSILLNGKSKCGKWLSAFDPWWYCRTKNDRTSSEIVQFPDDELGVNVRINMHHLLEHPYCKYKELFGNGKAYPMGCDTKKHFLTVIKCESK